MAAADWTDNHGLIWESSQTYCRDGRYLWAALGLSSRMKSCQKLQ